jgi:hypothetical protein
MGMLAHGTTWLAAVTGCVPGETNAAALCPAGYDATSGDLQLTTWQLDTTTPVGPDAIGAQFVQASSAWSNVEGVGATSAGFVLPAEAGVAPVAVAVDAGFGALQPATLALVAGLTFDGTSSFFVRFTASSGDAAVSSLDVPLPAVQAATWPGAVPEAGVLRDGAGFVFVLVGNPTVVDGGALAPHVLALPVANP